jgi:hypothetical protein
MGNASLDSGTSSAISHSADLDKEALHILTHKIFEALDMPWGSSEVVKGLLRSSLEPVFSDILSRYLNSQLKVIAESIQRELPVKSGVNTQYVVHAKFHDIIEELKNRIKFLENLAYPSFVISSGGCVGGPIFTRGYTESQPLTLSKVDRKPSEDDTVKVVKKSKLKSLFPRKWKR